MTIFVLTPSHSFVGEGPPGPPVDGTSSSQPPPVDQTTFVVLLVPFPSGGFWETLVSVSPPRLRSPVHRTWGRRRRGWGRLGPVVGWDPRNEKKVKPSLEGSHSWTERHESLTDRGSTPVLRRNRCPTGPWSVRESGNYTVGYTSV